MLSSTGFGSKWIAKLATRPDLPKLAPVKQGNGLLLII